MFEPRVNNPLDHFRNALGDSEDKKKQFEILGSKVKVLEEQNDLLKAQNAELAKLQAILERFSYEKMATHDDKSYKLEPDIEMQAIDRATSTVLSPTVEKVDEIESENCDFSDVHNSTLMDTDMSDFGDSLFNTKLENRKEAPEKSASASEPCEMVEVIEATAPVFRTFDATMDESERASIPDEKNASDGPETEMVTNEIALAPSAVDPLASTESPTVEIEAASSQNDVQVGTSENASETFTFEKDSEMSCDSGVSNVNESFNAAYQLPTIVEETVVAAVEDNSETTESMVEVRNIVVYQLPTVLETRFEPQYTTCTQENVQKNSEHISFCTDVNEVPSNVLTSPSSNAATYGSECESIPNSQEPTLFGCPEIAINQIDAQAADLNTKQSIDEMETEPAAVIQAQSSTESASETAALGNDSVLSNELTAIASTSSDTLSVDVDTISNRASPPQLLVASSEAVITEIRTQIIDAVMEQFNENDQRHSTTDNELIEAPPAIVSHQDTLDDIDLYIQREQGDHSYSNSIELTDEVAVPQTVLETREPISAQFNSSQIVSLDYTLSGTEILTLDVPVSNDTSLPLSQFESDIGEEGDYLLPPRSRDSQSKMNESAISFGSQPILETTGDYHADEEPESSSSSTESTVALSENFDTDSANQSIFDTNEDIVLSEKNGKRKLADDCETEFLLSKSRKPEVESTPFS